MELKQLRFLVTCAQTKSFSKAANLLFTAQSNVSKVIKSLEEELGVELFERKQYGIALTEDGQRVYEYARATLDSARKITDLSRQKMREELRISCNPSSWMARCFREYFNSHERPDVSYYIMTASTNAIIRRLASDVDQLGFVYIMEDQLPVLEYSFARNHINFTLLRKTNAMLYFGNRNAKKAYSPDQDLALIQGYEDEFTLRSYWSESEQSHHENAPQNRIVVTTNSDYVMNEMLAHTRLGNISGGPLSGSSMRESTYSLPLYEEENKVLFGCLFRNDRTLGHLPLEYLNFVRKRVEG